MSNSLAIMRRDHTFPLVGQVMLCLFMLNALMGLRIIGPASHTSQGSLSSWVTSDNFDTAVSSGTGIIERFAAQRLLLPIPARKPAS